MRRIILEVTQLGRIIPWEPKGFVQEGEPSTEVLSEPIEMVVVSRAAVEAANAKAVEGFCEQLERWEYGPEDNDAIGPDVQARSPEDNEAEAARRRDGAQGARGASRR